MTTSPSSPSFSRTGRSSRSSARARTSATGPTRLPGSWAASHPSGGELAQTLADAQPVPRPRPRPAAGLAVRRRDPRRGAALPLPARRLRRELSADLGAPPARAPAGAPARARAAPAAPPDDELRRPARARVRGCGRAVRRRLVRGEARAAPGPLPPPPARGRGRADRASERVHGPRTSKAAGHPQAARGDRPEQRQGATATSSPRTATSTTWSAATWARQIPFSLLRAHGRQPLPLPRLLDARLEPARDPEPHLGRQQLDLKSWAVQRAPTDAGVREVEEALWRDRGDVDLLYVPLKEYVDGSSRSSRLERARMSGRPRRRSPARERLRRRPTSASSPTARRTPPFFFGRDEESGSSPATCAPPPDAPLRRERRRQDLAPAGGRRPRPARAVRGERADAAERAPFAICAFAAWRDDPLPALMETIRAAAVEALGGDGLTPWRARRAGRRDAARLDRAGAHAARRARPVRGLLPLPPGRGRRGTFAGEFPRSSTSPNLRVHFLLSIREDALGEARPLQGAASRASSRTTSASST